MSEVQRIQELVKICNYHDEKYYTNDKPEISDKEYDKLYYELKSLEEKTGFIIASSPTQKIKGEILPFLNKVVHTKPMLSADKSKNIDDVLKFMKDKVCILSWKLDGLTLVLKYDNGVFKQAITRGRHGIEGEDVTHTVRHFTNLPLKISYAGYLELRGEGLISYKDFNRINDELIKNGEETYSSPRNLASGSVRQLDSNITKNRNLFFIAFGIIKCEDEVWDSKYAQLAWLQNQGFETVYHEIIDKNTLVKWVEIFKSMVSNLSFLTDGLIIEFEDITYGKSLGSTGHHSRAIYAMKWNDDNSETIFRGVELNTTRTGITSITGLFDEVEIDGVKVSRASLHNYDIFEDFEFGIGDVINVYRANSVIPQIEENITRSGTYKIDMKCPSCGSDLVIKKPKESRFLFCENKNCTAKLLSKFVHFVSKDAMNIEGLSEATLEKFVSKGFVVTFADIYSLDKHKNQIINMDGFGIKSWNKLWNSIQKSKIVKLENFVYALGIPLIGVSTAKTISKYFKGEWFNFQKACLDDEFDFAQLKDFGQTTSNKIHEWFNDLNERRLWTGLTYIINFTKQEEKLINESLEGLTFVVTGSVNHFTNRKELQSKIEELGGKCVGSVSKNTNYLINNDITSASGKNKTAIELGVKIISEELFLEMIK